MSRVKHYLCLQSKPCAITCDRSEMTVRQYADVVSDSLSDRLNAARSLFDLVPGAQRKKLHVILPNRAVCFLGLPWNDEFLQRNGIENQARLQFMSIWGGAAAEQVRVIDDAPYGVDRLAIGMDRHSLLAMQSLATEVGADLVSVRPLLGLTWEWASSRILEKKRRFCLVEDGELYLLTAENNTIRTVASQSWRDNWVEALDLLCKRSRLRGELEFDEQMIHVLNLSETPAPAMLSGVQKLRLMTMDAGDGLPLQQMVRVTQDQNSLDFVPQKSKLRGWRLLCLVSGVLLAALAGFFALQSHHKVSAAENALYDAQASLSHSTVSRSHIQTPELQKEITAANQLIRLLNIPTPSILKAVTPLNKEKVAILSLELNPAQTSRGAIVKITAEGRSAVDMAAYLSRLNMEGFFDSAYLTHHEVVSSGADRAYRFAVEAQWKE